MFLPGELTALISALTETGGPYCSQGLALMRNAREGGRQRGRKQGLGTGEEKRERETGQRIERV